LNWDKRTRDRLRKFDIGSRLNMDVIRFDSNSGIEHREHILKLTKEAIENGEHFLTRARLNNGYLKNALVADFYNIDWNTVYEVIDHEPVESIQRKARIWRNQSFHFEIITLRNKSCPRSYVPTLEKIRTLLTIWVAISLKKAGSPLKTPAH